MTRPSLFAPACCAAIACAAPAAAVTPRETLTTASFATTDKSTALALVKQGLTQAEGLLRANPHDREAAMQRAVALGYLARLNRSPGEAKAARQIFESLATANPRDPESQLALATWHLDTVEAGFLAATLLKAKKDVGIAALDRAVAIGGNRAFFAGFAAMLRIRLNPKDLAASRALAEKALAAGAPTPLDRIAKRGAESILIPIRNGDGRAAAELARKLLPFGRID